MEITQKNLCFQVASRIDAMKDRTPDVVTGANTEKKGRVENGSKKAMRYEDTVVLSSRIKEIQRAKMLLESLPDIRTEKIETIRRQIENGTYRIQSDTVAARMVETALLDQQAWIE